MEFLFQRQGGDLYGALTVLTGLMQVGAMLVFVVHLWALRRSKRSRNGT